MRPFLFWALVLLVFSQLKTQELPVSQFLNRPSQLNPALTGEFQEDFRFYALNRAQWGAIDTRFTSFNMGGEINLRSRNHRRSNLGVGFYINTENHAEIFKQSNYAITSAFHYRLDKRSRHILGVGFSGSLNRNELDDSDLRFGNQYQYFTYQNEITHNENLSQYTEHKFGVGLGFNYSFIWSKSTLIQTGLSLKREVNNSGLPSDIQLFVKFEESFDKFRFRPGFLWQNFGQHNFFIVELISVFDVAPSADLSVLGGFGCRIQDAAVFHLGLEYRHVTLQASYDMTTSSLKSVESSFYDTNYLGAWEIALVWKGFYNKHRAEEFSIPCGFF